MDNNKPCQWKSICSKDIESINNKRIAFKKMSLKYVGLAAFTILVCLLILQIKVRPAIIVSANEKPIGIVQSKSDFNNVLNELEIEVQANDKNVKLNRNYKYKYTLISSNKIASLSQMRDIAKNSCVFVTEAHGIFVNGECKVALKSQSEANEVLNEIKRKLSGNENPDVEFLENVSISKGALNRGLVTDYQGAIQILTQGNDKIIDYVVKKGDTLWDISDNNKISVEKLMELNPNKLEKIYPGQIIKLSMPNYVLNVKSVEKMEIEEKTSFVTEYRIDNTMYKGDKEVLSTGSLGKKIVKLQLTKQNGIQIEKKVLEEVVVASPKKEIVALGTKESGNIFRRPAYGAISSRFGFRSGRPHEGIDIAGNSGDPIYAAAGGKVIYSGWESGYGNLIKIDHGDGYITYYGHNTKNLVSVGKKVSKGDKIATLGTTGNSTGPHLHFEVRSNGKPVDPMKFLK